MEGLSRRKRRIYLSALTLIFLIAAPMVVLYASGYRLSSDLEIIKTGGIHIAVPTAGARFYLNGAFEGRGTIFQKSFFIQNLTPDTYTVRVEKEGYHAWSKELEVFPTTITEGRAFLLPMEPELTPILPVLSLSESVLNGSSGGGEEVALENPRYREILRAFVATSTGIAAAAEGATTTIEYEDATTTVYARGGVGLWLDDGGLHAWWLKDMENAPHVFCELNECTREILVAGDISDVHHLDFLPRDALFIVLERSGGIVVTELDVRTPQNTQPLYPKAGAQFRIIGDTIYILDGEELFEVKV